MMTDLLSVVSEAEMKSFPTLSQLSENGQDRTHFLAYFIVQ